MIRQLLTPSYFLQKSWNFGNMEVFTCLQHCISLQWAVVHEEGLPPPLSLCHTHAYQSPCSIIEICIIHESFKSFQSTCDSQTLPLSCSPHKMPAVQLPTVWLPAEEEARVHPSDPSNIHTIKWCTGTWRKAGEWKCFRLHVYLLVSGLLHAYLELQACISGRAQRCKF